MTKSHGLRWLGAALACIGGLSLLCASALVAWQYASRLQTGKWTALPASSMLGSVPEELAWILERVHIGVPFAAIGFALLALGAVMVLRQNELIRIEAQAAADRLRRVRLGQYGDPAERREPYIGASTPDLPEGTRKAA